jgi:hypothetical protein
MNRYNKLKIRALSVFAFTGAQWLRPDDVAERLKFSPPRSAWTYLKRLWKYGLLERRSSANGRLEYRISIAGTARLRWLRSHLDQ